jgi:lipopolysaccharide transport system permease protein
VPRVVSDNAAWIENRPRAGAFASLNLAEIWRYRDLAYSLTRRDLQLRYKQTIFGVAWAVIQPVGAALIFTLIFGHAAGLPSDGIPYPVFVLAGLAVWFYFSTAIEAAAQSMVENTELVTKVYFPRLLNPLAAVMPGLVDLALSMVVVGVFMVVYGVAPSIAVLLLPAWVVAVVLVAFGTGVWLSALNVLYRDVRYTLVFLVQLWFFATPIVYSASIVHGDWRYVLYANPVAGIVEGFRWSLVGGPAPGAAALISAAVAALAIATGLAYFQRVERDLADRI